MTGTGQGKERRHAAQRMRSAARLAAVQALYQIEQSGARPAEVVDEFLTHRVGRELDGETYVAPDPRFFADLVEGAWARRGEIDALVDGALSRERTVARLEQVMRAVLRAGGYEIVARPDVPTAVVVSEYVDIAAAFFGAEATGLVNGVLDHLARAQRREGAGDDGAEAAG